MADIHAAGFDGDLTYSPPNTHGTAVTQSGGDVDIFAYGLRNPSDPGTSPAANARDRATPDMLKPWRTAEANNGVDLIDALASLQSLGTSARSRANDQMSEEGGGSDPAPSS